MRRLAPLALALLGACASSPRVPPPAAAAVLAAPAAQALPVGDAARLGEAARLLADGVALDRAAALLDGVSAEVPGRELLLGQLAELRGDDAVAAEAYGRALDQGEDPEVRLRRALALERLGRGAEVAEDLARLRPDPEARLREPEGAPRRTLRPLRPSAR